MRAPRGKTSGLLLLLLLPLLLLLTTLTPTVFCHDEAVPEGVEAPEEDTDTSDGETLESTSSIPTIFSTIQSNTELTADGNNPPEEGSAGSEEPYTPGTSDPDLASDEDEGLDITIILIPVVLVFLIIAMIAVGIYISRRWNSKALNKDSTFEDTNMDASSTEKVPMPMFEEDVPSVLELEMEELDQWINRDNS